MKGISAGGGGSAKAKPSKPSGGGGAQKQTAAKSEAASPATPEAASPVKSEAASPATPEAASPATPEAASPATPEAPGPEKPLTTNAAAALEGSTSDPPSDPTASKEIMQVQADTSLGLTAGTDEEGRSLFDVAENPTAAQSERVNFLSSSSETQGNATTENTDPADHLVDNPIEEEQRTDLETPEGFEPGSEVPETPDFSEQEPQSTRELPNGGGTEETYEVDGVTYTRTRRPDGSTNTSYEVDGVTYSSTDMEDGSNSTHLSTSGENGTHSRTVNTDANGELQNDSYHAAHAETDPETGEITLQSRDETLNADNVRTTNETVVRPDGGRAELSRVEQADGSVEEVYNYRGDEGTVNRTTNTLPDGSGETRTEKNYTSDQSLEELAGGITPPVPEHADGVVPLP